MPPKLWADGGNLPWHDPAFSERMLREHLNEKHGAASRIATERAKQVAWLWKKLNLQSDNHLFDVTCGPGLYAVEFAQRGCLITGIDFSPASIAYAIDLAKSEGVAAKCHFIEQDIRTMDPAPNTFEAAILLYGQLAVFQKKEAVAILTKIARALKPGGRLCLELLDQDKVDKTESTWWFTDETGLWGETPFLHLGERFWDPDTKISTERFHIVHLENGELTEVTLCDQTYSINSMIDLLKQAGFQTVDVYPAWDALSLYDAEEWVVYVAEK